MSFSFLFSNLMIGFIGTAFFIYGKKVGRPWPLAAGLLMCIYPFFITNVLTLWLITIALCTGVYLFRQPSST
jgi:hypothetical protein